MLLFFLCLPVTPPLPKSKTKLLKHLNWPYMKIKCTSRTGVEEELGVANPV